MREKGIVLVGTFDTKAEESLYLKQLIEKNGYNVISIDVGTGARGDLIFIPDYTRDEVLKLAGATIEEILSLGEIGKEMEIMDLMSIGATKICQQLLESHRLQGIVSIGGTMGTNLGTTIMRALPFGVPKVMLSTIASGDMRPFIGTSDITVIPSIADIAGLNWITEMSLCKAAGAIMGMVAVPKVKTSEMPLIGITTIGGTTGCALQVKKRLEKEGYGAVIFHANGTGGQSMEQMISQGFIQGVFDLSINEVVDHIYCGWSDAGPLRVEAAGGMKIPQLIVPGNTDHTIYTSADKIPDRFKNRPYHRHGPSLFVLRTKKNEMIEVAKVVADKINKAQGPTAVIFPLRGLSILDITHKDLFDDPEANHAFLDVLVKNVKPEVEIKEVDAHITDIVFAEEAAAMILKLMNTSKDKLNKSDVKAL